MFVNFETVLSHVYPPCLSTCLHTCPHAGGRCRRYDGVCHGRCQSCAFDGHRRCDQNAVPEVGQTAHVSYDTILVMLSCWDDNMLPMITISVIIPYQLSYHISLRCRPKTLYRWCAGTHTRNRARTHACTYARTHRHTCAHARQVRGATAEQHPLRHTTHG